MPKPTSDCLVEHIYLDFDGTIVVYEGDEVYIHPEIIRLLNACATRGIAWHTNSGRGIGGQLDILKRSAKEGLCHWPATVCCGESFIYERRDGGEYLPLEPWNSRVSGIQRAFHARLQRFLEPQLPRFRQWVPPEQTYMADMGTYFFLDEKSPDHPALCAAFDALICEAGGGQLVKNGAWLFALPYGISKGELLKHYMELRGMDPARVLAVGDHENDLTMLNGSSAGLTGCPANAIPEVKQAVMLNNGHVASKDGPLGTLEVFERFQVPREA